MLLLHVVHETLQQKLPILRFLREIYKNIRFFNFKPSPFPEKMANGITTWPLPVLFATLFIDVNTETLEIFAALWWKLEKIHFGVKSISF